MRNLVSLTTLSRALVREALVILMQHGLAKYSETIQGIDRVVIHYVAVESEILLRERAAAYICIARDRFGDKAAEIVEHILAYGAQCHDSIVTACGISCTPVFAELCKARLVIPSTSRDSLYSLDSIMKREAEEVSKMGVPPTKVELTKLRKRLAEERDEADLQAAKRTKLSVNEAGGIEETMDLEVLRLPSIF